LLIGLKRCACVFLARGFQIGRDPRHFPSKGFKETGLSSVAREDHP
jgi:hypothetical protein